MIRYYKDMQNPPFLQSLMYFVFLELPKLSFCQYFLF